MADQPDAIGHVMNYPVGGNVKIDWQIYQRCQGSLHYFPSGSSVCQCGKTTIPPGWIAPCPFCGKCPYCGK